MSSPAFIGEAKKHSQKQIAKLDDQLDRLTVGYLDAGAFTAVEFRKRKEEALNRKRQQLDIITALERDDMERFEPITRFINK
jgi:predicted metal-dependent hydrolase